ncbi:MAG: VanW family protein [Anaerolineales bacterium]|nr:VanW family protein [Anaerolineales bacterium]
MRTYPAPPSTEYSVAMYRSAFIISQVLISLVFGVIIFIMLVAGLITLYEIYHTDQVYPGVKVAGFDLSGMEYEQAQAILADKADFPERGRILFRDNDQIWLASPADLGFRLDLEATLNAAFQIGRQGNFQTRFKEQFDSLTYGKNLAPQYVFNAHVAEEFLQDIALEIDRPTIEASLHLEGVEVVVQDSQVGRSLGIWETIENLTVQLQSLRDGEVPLVITETPPIISEVEEQAQFAHQILSNPLTLSVPNPDEQDNGPWTFSPEVVAEMMTIQRVNSPEGDHYQVTLDAGLLEDFLIDISPLFVREKENARMIFDDETRQLQLLESASIGRELDIDGTIQVINEQLAAGEHHVELQMTYLEPDIVDDVTAEELGIRELVGEATSYFYGSSRERLQNIRIASARFHGLMVPPGATFSMVEALGTISLDEGYAEALIIYAGRTIQGVGGGVCQVSTTLFRTIFMSGYPIVERHPHAYRVRFYEQTPDGRYDSSLAGLDAAVYVPIVDLKFKNDSPNWLLMETYVRADGNALTWKFYSTSDGRSVEWSSTGLRNIKPPPDPLYEENPDLQAGEIKQVDWAVEGAEVTITRNVMRDGEVYLTDTIYTRYLPWKAVYQYGPGTEGMPPDQDNGNGEE